MKPYQATHELLPTNIQPAQLLADELRMYGRDSADLIPAYNTRYSVPFRKYASELTGRQVMLAAGALEPLVIQSVCSPFAEQAIPDTEQSDAYKMPS